MLCDDVVRLALGAFDNPILLAQKPQSEKWNVREDNNPYFSHVAQTKRAKKYVKEVRAVFSEWKKRWLADAQALIRVDAEGRITPEEWIAAGNATLSVPVFTSKLNNIFIEQELLTAYNEVVDALEQLHDIKISHATLNTLSAEELETYMQYHLRLAGNLKESTVQGIKSEIVEAYTKGESNQQLAKRITDRFAVIDSRRAITIARTETSRASNEGARLSFVAAGIEQFDVLPATDACINCISVADQNPYDVKEQFALLPVHPSCRCTIVPHGL